MLMIQQYSAFRDGEGNNSSPEVMRAQLAKALRWLEPMFDQIAGAGEEGSGAYSAAMIDAINALNAGETPEIFAPSARRGKETNAYTLNKLRLELVLLGQSLDRTKLPMHEVDKMFVNAVGHQWDTVSRWDKSARNVLVPDTIAEIERSVADRVWGLTNRHVRREIKSAGHRYNAARRKN
ncbi:hypothetical protein [Sphingomonas panaciterrae]|uniref:hypothetical protein n=1 Tax=Sphingomonas panaciterrae TaxID=1462999 RepID=UPI002FEE8F28